MSARYEVKDVVSGLRKLRQDTHHYGFVPMAGVVPEGESGSVRIDHFVIEDKLGPHTLRWALHPEEWIAPGKYARLLINGGTVMSDTQMEQRSNYEAVSKATGHVLIAGLGLGMVLLPILKKKDVKSVTVIEKNPDVIAMITSAICKAVGKVAAKKLNVIQADIREWRPALSVRQFDTIYFDIWSDMNVDEVEDRKTLHAAFRKYLRKGGWIGSWQYDHLRDLRRRGRWR